MNELAQALRETADDGKPLLHCVILKEVLRDAAYVIDRLEKEIAAIAATQSAQAPGDLADIVSKAMRRAWNLGKTYWQQADSDYTSHHRKADDTARKFEQLVDETRSAVTAAPVAQAAQEPEGWKLVPIEPTKEMFATTSHNHWEDFEYDYKAAIAAAPVAQAAQEPDFSKCATLDDYLKAAQPTAQAPVQRIKGELSDEQKTELLDWVSACQSAYHIDNTPGHRFGGLGSNLQENRDALIEYVESLLSVQPAVQAPSDAKDAQRYRYLRESRWFQEGFANAEPNSTAFHYIGKELDQLVDAAMQENGNTQEGAK